MFASGFFAEELAARVGWTLIHSLWQIALIGGLFWIMNRKLARRSANLRYVVGCVAMVLMLVVPVCWLAFATSTIPVSSIDLPSVSSERPHPVPEREQVGWAGSHTTDRNDEIEAQRTTSLIQTASGSENGPLSRWHGMARFIAAIWFVGVMLLSTRPALGFAYAGRLCRVGKADVPESVHGLLRRVAEAMNVRRAVQVGQSTLAKAPCVVGWFRPVILLPASAVTGLTTDELESILAHELAHIRRHDYLVNLVQMAIETLLFFHPVMWWVSQCVRREREYCCDDIAVQVCGDRTVLIDALLAIGEVRARPRLVLASDGTVLFERVERILEPDDSQRHEASPQSLPLAIVSAALLTIALGAMHFTQKQNSHKQELHEEQTMASKRDENWQVNEWQRAMQAGDAKTVARLLSEWKGYRRNNIQKFRRDGTWFSLDPLCEAARNDSLPIARLLVEYGNEPNVTIGQGAYNASVPRSYCLAWAVSNEMRNFLIENGADPASIEGVVVPNLNDETVPLEGTTNDLGLQWQFAVESGDEDRVRELLLAHPHLSQQLIKDRDRDRGFGNRDLDPMHRFASSEQLELVKLMLKSGYDKSKLGVAMEMATPKVAEYLLDLGVEAKPEIAELSYLAGYEAIEFWLKRGHKIDIPTLHNACCGRGRMRGHEQDENAAWPERYRQTVRVLIEHGADVNARMPGDNLRYGGCKPWVSNRETPLHFAAGNHDPQLVQMLLDAGADKMLTNDLGETPYDWAVKFDAPGETRELLAIPSDEASGSASPTAGNTNSLRFLSADHPFVVAVREADLPRIKQLVADDGSLVNAQVRGNVSLMGKTWKDGKEVDADGDCPEHAGALHFAAFHPGHSELAQLLLELGADLEATSFFGEKVATPVTLACWQGDDETLKVILNAAKATETRLDLTPGLFTTLAHGGDTDLLMEHGAKHDIFTAAMAGGLDVLQQLIEENTKSVDRQHPEYGRTPLEQALIVGQRASAELLVKHGAKVQPSAAAALGHLQEIETLLDKDGDAVNQQFGGYTPLIWAIRGGQDDVVKLLLKHGADPNGGDRWRSTPLGHVAELAYENGDALVDLLVAAGADVNQKSRGSTPLGRAEGCGNELVIEALKRHGARGDSETESSSTDDSNDLVQKWSDAINDRDYDRVLALLTEHPELGETRFFPREKLPGYHSATYDPSAYATMTNDLELMEAFFKGGVTPNFGTAAESPEMAKLVIKYGKDTEGFADTVSNELFPACWFANLEIQRVLLDAGADPNVRKGNSGIRPLMYVASRGKGEEGQAAARQLIEHGADVNAKSYSGFDDERTRHDGYNHDVEHGHETPLHWAARKGNAPLVQLLLDHGANPDAKTTSVRSNKRDDKGFYLFEAGGGETPRDWAFQSGDEATIRLLNGDDALDNIASAARAGLTDRVRSLIASGENANTDDSNGKSAIQYAIQRRDAELCRALTEAGAAWPETITTAITMGVPSVVKSLLASDPQLKEKTLSDPLTFFAQEFDLDSFHVESIRAIMYAKPESPIDLVLAGYIQDKDVAEAIVAARPDVISEAITAFPQAACYFVFDVALLERVLDAGANIDARGTPHGYTPLQRAVWTSQLDSVQLLVKRGADLEIESHNHRWRTLDIPCYQSKRRVDHRLIKILLDAGADPNVEAHNGYTVLDALHHYAKKLTDEEREQAKEWVRAAGGKTYKELVQEKKGLATDEHG